MKTMRFSIAILLFIWVSPLLGDQASLKSKISSLVSRYDGLPTKQEWLALGTGAEQTMIQLFNEWSEMRPWQARILNGLRYYPTPAVQQFLGDIADRNELIGLAINVHLQREAISSLVAIHGAQELPRLQRLLGNRDWRLRAHVLEKLTEIGGEPAMRLVREHLKVETNVAVKSRAQRLLRVKKRVK